MSDQTDGGFEFREADRLEITILVDNYVDSLLIHSTDTVKRPMTPPPNWLLAEHGLSCLLKVSAGSEEHLVMMDFSVSPTCLLNNLRVLRKDPAQIESAILSHGHFDHFGGLIEFLKVGRKGIPLLLHPEAFNRRRLNIPSVGAVETPSLQEEALRNLGADIKKADGPATTASGLVLSSGVVRRTTSFEMGFPSAEALIDGKWVVDPFRDDIGIAVRVRGKGLVIISGCAHSGIINTVRHLQSITGEEKVHAVLGGFHLTGPMFDPIIAPTIEEMKKIGPEFIIPMHCTGWKAIGQFAMEMPQQFVLNTAGTTYVFQ